MGVLRRRVQGPDPRQRLRGRGRRGRGQPPVHRRLARLRPALRVRHRPGPGPVPERQAAGRAGHPLRAAQLLGRGAVRQPRRRAGAAATWCRNVAGQRIHGTIQARPAGVFADGKAGMLLPVPARYDVPVFTKVKSHLRFPTVEGGPVAATGRRRVLRRQLPGAPRRQLPGQAAPPRSPGQDPPGVEPAADDRPG